MSLRAAPHLFSFTFCKSCQIWQPQRTNHCPICQTCVLQLDHHCHWLGTCLGARNYHLFYWYLFHLVLLCICQLVYTGLYLWRVHAVRSKDNEDDHDESDDYFVSVYRAEELIGLPIIVIYVVAIGQWVCKLFVFHQFYVAPSGRTAYEMIKGHQANFEESPHLAGASGCAYFCKIACRCFRRSSGKIPASRMGSELEMASRAKSTYYSLN